MSRQRLVFCCTGCLVAGTTSPWTPPWTVSHSLLMGTFWPVEAGRWAVFVDPPIQTAVSSLQNETFSSIENCGRINYKYWPSIGNNRQTNGLASYLNCQVCIWKADSGEIVAQCEVKKRSRFTNVVFGFLWVLVLVDRHGSGWKWNWFCVSNGSDERWYGDMVPWWSTVGSIDQVYTFFVSSVDEKAKSFHDGFISKTLCCQGSEGKRKASAMEAGSGLVFS